MIIDTQEGPDEETDEWKVLIPVESELYFPLSPDYCAFLFFPGSEKKSNPLRTKKKDKISVADEDIHARICERIGRLGRGRWSRCERVSVNRPNAEYEGTSV